MSKRCPAVVITDSDFANDIAHLSNTAEQAHALLIKCEKYAKFIELYINKTKTEYIIFNQNKEVLQSNDISIITFFHLNHGTF